MEFSFEYSPLWLLPAAIVISALVWWLYLASRGAMDWPSWLRRTLGTLRWLLLMALCVLLIQPFLTRWITDYEKPILAIYQDASTSLDTLDRQLLKNSLGDDLAALEEKYEVRWMSFGEEVVDSSQADELSPLYTDLGLVKEHLANRFYNQNVGAVVVATDGIQNKGLDPRYVDDGHSAPYFFVALGDSAFKPDARILEVLNNKLVFLNNDFQVKVRVGADQLAAENFRVTISRNGETIHEQEMEVVGNRWVKELNFTIKAEEAGLSKYDVRIAPVNREVNLENNSASFYIDVLDNRTRIHIIGSAPHPDIGALRRSIEQNEQYEVSTYTTANWQFPNEGVDLVVLHGFPGSPSDMPVLQRLQREKIPIWYVLSSTSNVGQLQRLLPGFSMEGRGGSMDEVGGLMTSGFNLFNAPGYEKMNRLPPLKVPFGDLNLAFQHQVLMSQRIGTVETDRPLWLFYEENGQKGSILLAEGLWRWRMTNYQLEENTTWFDELATKTVQYLSVRQKRTRLQVNVPQRMAERTNLEVSAELYNESFELTNEPEVRFTLRDSSGNDFDYTFKPDGQGYAISIGNLKAGEYTWEAVTTMNEETFSEKGQLTITEVKAEQIVTRANHDFLRKWADRDQGNMFYASSVNQLSTELLNLEQAKPQVISEKDWSEIIEWKWLLGLLALVVTIEWFMRKYHGSY